MPKPVLWLGLLTVSFVGAWQLGNFQGHAKAQAQIAELLEMTETGQLRMQAVESSYQLELEQLLRARDIADARSAALQSELEKSLKQSIDDASELALYRRIENNSESRGVWVDKVSLVKGQPDVLQITVMQSRGRERAVGKIGVTLMGRQEDRLLHWVVTGADDGAIQRIRAGSQGVAVSGGMVESVDLVTVGNFDLRFFQTVLVKAKNITTINPEFVQISIYPEGERLKPSTEQFRWSEILHPQSD